MSNDLLKPTDSIHNIQAKISRLFMITPPADMAAYLLESLQAAGGHGTVKQSGRWYKVTSGGLVPVKRE